MPLLTIAIPVHNAERHISATLKSVFESIAVAPDIAVEVLVLDNDSSDSTEQCVRHIDDRESLRYLRNTRNEGLNYSVERLVREAAGEFVWFLGAQEELELCGVTEVGRITKQLSPEIVLLNFKSYSEAKDHVDPEINYAGKLDRTWTSTFWFFFDVRGPALAMSANVVRRTTHLEATKSPLISRHWALLERLLDCSLTITERTPACLISSPAFTLYREIDGWWTTEAVYPMFLEMVTVLNEKLKRRPLLHQVMFRRQSGRALLRSTAAGKRNGLVFNRVLVRKSAREFRWSPTFWAIGLPMVFAPNGWFSSNASTPH